jgi:hypothetical protein
MGTVFLAQSEAGRQVALKMIHPMLASDEQFRARFQHEASAARRVARFCTAQVLDVGADGDIPFMVTEYIDGPTLAAEVDASGTMHGSTLDGLALGVAAALNGIHSAGIVHRDLKPSNVMLSRVGPKVIDFGIARAWESAGPDMASITSIGLMGTLPYMSPEQVDGGRVGPASDVFSWGGVVAFAAGGRPPFGQGSLIDVARRVINDEPDLAALDGVLRDIVASAMRRNPDQRPTARTLLLRLIGDTQDPVQAATFVLSTTWPGTSAEVDTQPALAKPEPAESEAANAACEPANAQSTPDRRRRPLTRARPWTLVAIAVAVVTAVALSVAVRLLGLTPPAAQSQGSGGDVRIALGERYPAAGFVGLSPGETHRYTFVVDAGQSLYLEGMAQGCAHLMPFTILDSADAQVASGELGCGSYGPISVTRGGPYELRVGGPGVDGSYALRVTAR